MSSNQAPSQTAEPGACEVPETSQQTAVDIEKLEEEKLKAKYEIGGAGAGGLGRPGGASAFLQKRWLQKGKGPKYFDSGDYQMAKQKDGQSKSLFANKPTPGIIPTPESVPTKKMSITPKPNIFPTSSS